MSRYDSRASDPGSYWRRDVGFGSGSQSYGRGYESSGKRQAEVGAHWNGPTPFEKNFYVESPSMAKAARGRSRSRAATCPSPPEFRDVAFLDVKDVKYVINYDFPGSLEGYVHCIGCTGRAGAKGAAYTLLSAANAKFAKNLINILEEAEQKERQS
ncbi:hypothetical protein COCNU_02G000840 [Cocos nucifera]|uniref:Helicase C-terminal domain-containing protein n=1 Tax=Cocos nucifera TaxID=13894 RepID=A0A8K0HXH6_COCNU|nr:hypothetical protein COCNU_02G000840 [Cocos nucifera]